MFSGIIVFFYNYFSILGTFNNIIRIKRSIIDINTNLKKGGQVDVALCGHLNGWC